MLSVNCKVGGRVVSEDSFKFPTPFTKETKSCWLSIVVRFGRDVTDKSPTHFSNLLASEMKLK